MRCDEWIMSVSMFVSSNRQSPRVLVFSRLLFSCNEVFYGTESTFYQTGKRCGYLAANAIVRHGKPFQEGEVLKEAWLACAPSLFDDFDNKDKIIQRIKDVPLSRNTMKVRILKLAENVTDQQKNDINSAPFISLCLDESIDITKSARLAVFARYCVGNIIKEELIVR
ncbi:uncharacterized protein TNCV_1483481 [Trichonephila clavipes]|nr:uncharacterized protein TNCV_1483481 [Trichonephila clavipes]